MDFDTHIVPALLRIHDAVLLIAVLLAPVAGVVRKGGDLHRRVGQVFVACLAVLFVCSSIIGAAVPGDFWLAALGFLALYMGASGYRSLYLKRLHQGLRPTYVDLILHGVGAAYSGALLIWGISHFALGERDFMAKLFLLLGSAGTLNVAINFLRFHKSQHDKREWLFAHISGMIGAYVVVLCTWSALHLDMLKPVWLQWFWPVVVGVPCILWLVHIYKQRFLRGVRIRDIADVRIR